MLIDKGVFKLQHENSLETIFEMTGNLNTETYIGTFSSPGIPALKIDNIIKYIEVIGLKKIDDYTAIIIEKKSHEELNKLMSIRNIISNISNKIVKYTSIDTKNITIHPYIDIDDRRQRPNSSFNDIHKNLNKKKKYKI